MNIFPEVELKEFQAEAIARGLYAIAKADGVHEREAALIAGFWTENGGNRFGLAELERREQIGSDELAEALPTAQQRELFVKTALLLAFVDGEVSKKESELVRGFADKLGLKDALPKYEEQVKEYLLAQLSHVHNAEGLAKIAKKLAL